MSRLLKILIFRWRELLKLLKTKQKNKNGGFLSMLLGVLRASLLGNLLSGKVIVRAGYGDEMDF